MGLGRTTQMAGKRGAAGEAIGTMQPVSDAPFMLKDTTASHRCSHGGKNPSSCQHCAYRSRSGTSGRGKGIVSPIKVHHCPYCSYTSNFTTNMINHMRTHTGEKPFSCPHCPYRANQRTNLTMHVRTHTGEKPYACLQCPYRSSRKDALKSHMLKHAPVSLAEDSAMS